VGWGLVCGGGGGYKVTVPILHSRGEACLRVVGGENLGPDVLCSQIQ